MTARWPGWKACCWRRRRRRRRPRPGSAPAEAARLDARVRALFDPDGVLAARAGSGAVGAKGRE
ncbi:hypothetical protein L574_1146 [Bordetella pertussis STO1-SEAT-0006]|nr:hypothetical protein L574_1146 [Bordetella pertussis STO1-SEAT-0006]